MSDANFTTYRVLIDIRVTFANDNEKRGYKKLAKQMMDSASSLAYFETLNILENFIHGQSGLQLHWWDNHRLHWAKEFKCDLMSPSSNLAEAVNASYAHRGSCNISLVRAA